MITKDEIISYLEKTIDKQGHTELFIMFGAVCVCAVIQTLFRIGKYSASNIKIKQALMLEKKELQDKEQMLHDHEKSLQEKELLIGSIAKKEEDLKKREDILKEKEEFLKSGILQIDRMDGKQFERCLKVFFEQEGYKVELTKETRDKGGDLLLFKDGEKTVIQAKCYSGVVSLTAVQEVLGAKGYYNADKMMVITNSIFTKDAVELAIANDVELWDRYQLILRFTKESLFFLEEENRRFFQNVKENTCPICGDRLIRRDGMYGVFLSCVNNNEKKGDKRCRYTRSVTKKINQENPESTISISIDKMKESKEDIKNEH